MENRGIENMKPHRQTSSHLFGQFKSSEAEFFLFLVLFAHNIEVSILPVAFPQFHGTIADIFPI